MMSPDDNTLDLSMGIYTGKRPLCISGWTLTGADSRIICLSNKNPACGHKVETHLDSMS